jgi:polysaccharide chain length determinant protein (PEP-CTERM system associated)
MIQNGEISMADVKRVLRKYWWILPLTVVSGGALGIGATMVLSKRFTSQSRVQIREQSVSQDLVKPILTEATSQRLSLMQEEILSRTQLQALIEKFGLYPSESNTTHMEELVMRLRKSIEVTPPDTTLGGGNRLPGFYINVTFESPEIAQHICSEITSKFLERNTRYTNETSTKAVEFLGQQAEDAKRKLDQQDQMLAGFKQKYMGSLPDSQQMNLGMLTTLNLQLEANTQTVSRAQQDKAMNESLLASQLQSWKASKTGDGPAPETLEQQLAALQEQLSTLQARYTPEHPDVIKTKYQIEQLRKRMDEAPNEPSATPARSSRSEIEPPAIQQLRAKLKQDELNIADLMKRQSLIQGQISVLQGRVQLSPAVEQQYKELMRSYQSASDFYNDLLKKRDQAAMARDLSKEQEGEQLSLEDPPSLPMTPSFPKKPVFAGVGLGGGLALGLAVLYLLTAMDSSMHSERDVETCLKLPVLAMVPTLDRTGLGHSNGKGSKTLGLAGAAK